MVQPLEIFVCKKKYNWTFYLVCVVFPLCSIHYASSSNIEEEDKVFFKKSVINFQDNYWRYCGDFHLCHYDFSPVLLLQTTGFSEFQGASPRDSHQGSACPGPAGGLTAPSIFPVAKGNDRGSSLTQQTFGAGNHIKVLETERGASTGDKKFDGVFNPVSTRSPSRAKKW